MTVNKTFIFKKIPHGPPVAGQDITIEDRPINLEDAPPQGGLVVEVLYASFDPYQRGRMRDPSIKSYSPGFELNGPITNGTVAKVLKSDSTDFKEGDLVNAFLPISEYAIIENPKQANVRKIHNPHNLDLALFLGPLGMPGLTAWSGLHEIGKPKKGETIFVSSAAGAVGQIVGQIAKREGLRVIGSVGSDEKLEFITKELGFDGGFNYKKENPKDAIPRLIPDGSDIYFENVGGDHLEAALVNLKDFGRIVSCGSISNYNVPPEQQKGVKGLAQITAKFLTMQGFIVSKHGFGAKYAQEHQEKLQAWIADGSVATKIHITEGIDNAAEGFIGLLEGKNFGKAVLKIK
ncbi:hypothetical protein G7046_g956 [Stylonectria norvegica]|nr:hypothetical protein G7046_g956 [Stylonectria norvegica]